MAKKKVNECKKKKLSIRFGIEVSDYDMSVILSNLENAFGKLTALEVYCQHGGF